MLPSYFIFVFLSSITYKGAALYAGMDLWKELEAGSTDRRQHDSFM